MAYSTRADIEARFGRDAVRHLVDEDASGSVASDEDAFINAAIATADHHVDSLLSNRYAVPFTDAPELVRDISCDLAFYEMSKRRGRTGDFFEKLHDDAIRTLAQLSKGKRSLPGVVPGRYANSTTASAPSTDIDQW